MFKIIIFLALVILGVFLLDKVRAKTKKIRNKIRRFFKQFSKQEETYVRPHKRTTTVKGHYRTTNKKKQKSKKRKK